MPAIRLDPARGQFQDRLLIQLRSRYRDWDFSPRLDDFGVLARKGGALVSVSLESLYATSARPGASAPDEISRFVTGVGPRLSWAEQRPVPSGPAPDPGALVWCVRAGRSIRAYSRFAELTTRELPGGLLAFVAEALPADAMRGVSRFDADASGLSEADLIRHADRNTSLRLSRWGAELAAAPEQRRWLFSDDILFSSSLLLVPAFLDQLAHLGRGRATVAAPDRAMVLAGVGEAAEPEALRPIVHRLFRLASNPLSPVLLTTDGQSLELHPTELRSPRSGRGWRRIFGGLRG